VGQDSRVPAERPPIHGEAPELDVVIVSHRCAALLDDCLTSMTAAAAGVGVRVHVVDTASGDATPEVARRHPVHLTALGGNVGFARANNIALARCTAPAVLVLNPDTVLPAGSLRRCLDALAARPELGVLTPRLVDRRGRLDGRCRRGFPHPWPALCFLTGLDRVLAGPRARGYTSSWLPSGRAHDVVAVSGAFMLLRRAALEETGHFDTRYFMYGEDVDLCLRLRRRGWRCRYWPGVEVVHVGGGSGEGGRRSARADTAFFRAMAPLLAAHLPGRRGRLTAGAVAVAAEAALLASRGRRAAHRLARARGR
jgi:GT2 family glycosyltransferase